MRILKRSPVERRNIGGADRPQHADVVDIAFVEGGGVNGYAPAYRVRGDGRRFVYSGEWWHDGQQLGSGEFLVQHPGRRHAVARWIGQEQEPHPYAGLGPVVERSA